MTDEPPPADDRDEDERSEAADRLPAYVLAGGRSRRFGSDKARVEVAGVPLIVRLAEQLRPFVSSVTVIARRPDAYADLGLPTVADLRPGHGPMTGLHTALHHVPASQPWLLLCSCDLLACPPTWLTALVAARTPTCRALAFRDSHWHPFPGLYHRSLTDEVGGRLDRDELRMQRLLDAAAAPAPLPADWPDVPQANTPADLARAMRQAESAP